MKPYRKTTSTIAAMPVLTVIGMDKAAAILVVNAARDSSKKLSGGRLLPTPIVVTALLLQNSY
jgi:hypothetical protein